MLAQIGGTISHGITKVGFKTIGIPNVIGSLILKIPIGADNLAMVLCSSRFENMKIAIINAKVTPEPPI